MATEKRTSVKQIVNNIIYVEPNYVHSSDEYGVGGLNTYELTPPLEDYSIFVNLEVEVRGRNVQSTKTANNKKLIMSYVTKTDGSSNVNFMQGSKIPIGDDKASINALTTNYTDLFLGDLKKNGPSTEMFGIQSIDISYNNYMVPEVTIEFIDVRGVSLFAQKEAYETSKNIDKAINSDNQEDIANTFFQCFFTFPYPKFTILVKGFYGQPVSYELTCADFRARFDSKTGNFACTAKFVGYYFSFLNDVMINGLVAAPYSDYIGAKYWAEQGFMLEGLSGNDFPIPKFGELLRNMKDIESTADKLAQSDPVSQELINYDGQKNRFVEIKNDYDTFVSKLNELIADRSYKGINTFYTASNEQGQIRGMIYLGSDGDKRLNVLLNDANGNIEGAYNGLVNKIKSYNEEFTGEKLPIPNSVHDKLPTQLIATQSNNESKAYVIGNAIPDIGKKGHRNYSMFQKLVISVENANKNDGRNPFLDKKYAYYYDDNRFSSTLEKYLEKINKRVNEANTKLEKLKDDTIANALGFSPTVENLTKIVMAHFETFARMIFETAKIISNQNPSRTISSLQINDIHNVPDVSNKGKNNETIVPPFPRVTQEVRRGDATNREEAWVGDYGDFREIDLVHGLINGVNEIAKEIINYEKSNASDETSSNNGPGYGGGSNTPTKSTMKYPLSPLDMIATEKLYGDDAFSQNEPSYLLGLVAMRAIQILGLTHFKSWGHKAEALGIAEAKNILAERNLNKEMLKKISAIQSNDVMDMLKGSTNGSIKKPGDGSKPWPWRIENNGGGIISKDGDLDICRVQFNAFSVPYQNLSWGKINKETIQSQDGLKAMWSNDYLNTKAYANCTKDNIFTFDTNINRFKVIVENQLKDDSNKDLGYYYNRLLSGDCTYSPERYEDVCLVNGDACDVIAYIIENAANMVPSDKSCMLPTSKGFYADKTFGGGYNMSYFADENPGEGGKNWKDKDDNEVKRKGANGYEDYLKEFNSRDFTFTEFPGVELDLEPDTKVEATLGIHPRTSIFAQGLYYKQNDIKARALLFLASLGYAFDYKEIIDEYICSEDKTIFVIPLPAVMFIGGLLWSNTTEGRKKLIDITTNHYKKSLELLLGLRDDVQRRFIKIFEKWVNSGVEGNSLLRSFDEIRKGMEIEFLKRTPEDFFRIMPEVEDNGALGWSTCFTAFDKCNYKSISDVLVNELGESFFRNYITIDEDVYGDATTGTRGLRLGNRDGGPSTVHACNFALAGCVFSKNSKYFMKGNGTNVKVNTGELKVFFDGFLGVLHEQSYDDNSASDNVSVSQASDPQDSTKDIKIGIYRYCKMIYDKWIAGLSEEEFKEKWTMNKFFDANDRYFYFIDAFYNSKSDVKLNIGDFCDQIVSCYRNDQYSLLSFLSSVYAKNKLNFVCVQNFLDLGKKSNMETMFDAVPYTSYWDVKRNPNFIVMFPYESSNYLEVENSEYENDGFMINMPPSTKNKWPEPLVSRNSGSNVGFNIPAFGVSYGKMYQSYFKDIDISMDSPTVTEQSIKAQFAIACQSNEGEQTGDRSQVYTYGQDLYSIYSNNSYTCNITMMGCAWIQPLMYFVLNNVPMFRGTYLIEKVWHHIEPGNMTTKFMGVRMSNVCTRIAEEDSARAKNNQDGSGSNSEDYISVEQKLAGIDNDCPYKAYPLEDPSDLSNLASLELKSNEMENAKLTVAAFVSMGYTDIAGAAVAGNIMQETHYISKYVNNMTPASHNPGMKGGVCQWQGPRLTKLVKWDMNATGNVTTQQAMPSFGKQLLFIDKECKEVSTYKNTLNALKSASTDDKLSSATETFRANYEGGSEPYKRIEFARQILKEYRNNPPKADYTKVEKNEDKHISKIAVGFLNALNKTAAASSENVVIGIDSKRSSGDTILLTNAQKSNNFSVVLDMILSAYSDKVDSVYWVLPDNGNNINSAPKYYLVHVKEGSKITKVYVSNEKSLNKAYGASTVAVSDGKSAGIHKDFCKALVKKYKTKNQQLINDTASALTDYDVLFKNNEYKLKDCVSVLKEAGIDSSYGVENEKGYIGDWNVGLFVNKLHYWQTHVCEEKGKKRSTNPGYNGCGLCTGAVNRALRDSGFGDKYWGEMPWNVYDKMIRSNSDFTEIASGSKVSNKTEFNLPRVQRGDICVMWTTNRQQVKRDLWHFHTCAFDGSNWISDFKQLTCNIYRSRSQCYLDWHLFRHKS